MAAAARIGEPGRVTLFSELGIHRLLLRFYDSYGDAGVDIIQTNTFGASPLRLAEYGLADRTEEINRTVRYRALPCGGGSARFAFRPDDGANRTVTVGW